jgi:hypothetical protein
VSRVSFINNIYASTTAAKLGQDAFESFMKEWTTSEHLYTVTDSEPLKYSKSTRRCPVVVAVRAEASFIRRKADDAMEPAGCSRTHPLLKLKELHADFLSAASELINAVSHRYELVADIAASRFQDSIVPLCSELSPGVVPRLIQKSSLMTCAPIPNCLSSETDIEDHLNMICTVRCKQPYVTLAAETSGR